MLIYDIIYTSIYTHTHTHIHIHTYIFIYTYAICIHIEDESGCEEVSFLEAEDSSAQPTSKHLVSTSIMITHV
jgi:hypothetical protein